jgi:hypothetical protein
MVAPHAHGATACLGRIGEALVAGGFSGPTDCQSADINLKKAGAIKERENIYDIYLLNYKTKAQGDLISHGGQRIIVFQGEKYIGQYALSPPPFHRIMIVKKSIVIGGIKAADGNTVLFTDVGPPQTAWIDGYVIKFEQ